MMRDYTLGDHWVSATLGKHRSTHFILVKFVKGTTHSHPDQLRKWVAFEALPRNTHNDDDEDDHMWLVCAAAT